MTRNTALLLIVGLLLVSASPAFADGMAGGDPRFPSCYTCGFFTDLNALKDSFTKQIFTAAQPSAKKLLSSGLILYFTWQGLGMVVSPSSANDRAKKMVSKGIPLTVITFIFATGGIDFIYAWMITPGEQVVLRYAALIMSTADSASAASAKLTNDGASYAGLASLVEGQMLSFMKMIARAITQNVDGFSPGTAFMNAIAGFVLLLPYMFVLSIWGAYMVEAMFKIVAVGIIAPLLTIAFVFDGTRPFSIAGLRILLGAGLTIIFASGAMGFSMSVVAAKGHIFEASMADEAGLSQAADDAFQARSSACAALNFNQADCTAAQEKYAAATAATKGKTNAFAIFSGDYFALFVIGFASVLLHLSAKTLASNISGANDGAGPAAATVAGAKMVLAGGAMAASRTAFGQSGAGNTLQAIAGGGAGGNFAQNALQHGAIGAGATSLLRAAGVGGGGSDSGSDGSLGGGGGGRQRYSDGGGNGGQQGGGMGSPEMQKTMQDFTKAMNAFTKGSGRDRNG
jgi:hypothetical protein